jgi:hypothetical protein
MYFFIVITVANDTDKWNKTQMDLFIVSIEILKNNSENVFLCHLTPDTSMFCKPTFHFILSVYVTMETRIEASYTI